MCTLIREVGVEWRDTNEQKDIANRLVLELLLDIIKLKFRRSGRLRRVKRKEMKWVNPLIPTVHYNFIYVGLKPVPTLVLMEHILILQNLPQMEEVKKGGK